MAGFLVFVPRGWGQAAPKGPLARAEGSADPPCCRDRPPPPRLAAACTPGPTNPAVGAPVCPADTALLLPLLGPPHRPLVPKLPVPPADPSAASLPAATDATKATNCRTPVGPDMTPSPAWPLCTKDVPAGSMEEEEEIRAEAEELQGPAEGRRKEPFGQEEPVLVGSWPPLVLPRELRVHLGILCPLLLPQPCLPLCSTHCPPLLLALQPILGDTGTPVPPSQGCGSALLQLPPCLWPCGTPLPSAQGTPGLPKPPLVGFLPLPQGPFPSCGAGGCPPPQGGMPRSAPQPEVPHCSVAKPPTGTGMYPLGKDEGRSKYECNVCAKNFGQLSNLKVPRVPPHPLYPPPQAWQPTPPASLGSAHAGDKGQRWLIPAVQAGLPVPQFPPPPLKRPECTKLWIYPPLCAPAVPRGAAGCSQERGAGAAWTLGSLGAPP